MFAVRRPVCRSCGSRGLFGAPALTRGLPSAPVRLVARPAQCARPPGCASCPASSCLPGLFGTPLGRAACSGTRSHARPVLCSMTRRSVRRPSRPPGHRSVANWSSPHDQPASVSSGLTIHRSADGDSHHTLHCTVEQPDNRIIEWVSNRTFQQNRTFLTES